jgi:hypothetical protein
MRSPHRPASPCTSARGGGLRHVELRQPVCPSSPRVESSANRHPSRHPAPSVHRVDPFAAGGQKERRKGLPFALWPCERYVQHGFSQRRNVGGTDLGVGWPHDYCTGGSGARMSCQGSRDSGTVTGSSFVRTVSCDVADAQMVACVQNGVKQYLN